MESLSSKRPIGSIPFESFFHGSWHETELVSILNGKTFVRIDHHGSVVEEEILGEHIRLHSRKANASDCSHLKVGIDVSVLSTCKISECSDYDPQQALPLWYDGKIVSKKYSPHENGCSCLFSVILYKERATNCVAKNIPFERTEVVTIDKIAILQKLNYELCGYGLCRWNCAEDCISYSRSKLLSGLFSSQISWLVVFSILKGMCFHIKSVDRNIVYQILEREQESVDHSQISDINTMYFKGSSEYSRPVIETLSPIVLERVEAETPSGNDSEEEKNEGMEMESDSDIEVLYDRKSLRRSKRQKIQPDRFTSFYSSKFESNSKRSRAGDVDPKNIQPNGFKNFSYANSGSNSKNNAPDVDKLEHKRRKQSASLAAEVQCSDSLEFCHEKSSDSIECVMPSPTSARKEVSDGFSKKNQSQNQHRLNVEQIHEERPSSSQDRLNKHAFKGVQSQNQSRGPRLNAKQIHKERPSNSQDQLNKHGLGETVRRKRGRPRLIEKGKACPLRVDSIYKKKSTCRKKLLSSLECKELIQEFMGNIRAEMEAEFQSKAQPEIIASDEQEDFIWPTTPEEQTEVEENNDLWKEMDHLLTKLALLEEKPDLDSDSEGICFGSDKACQHDFKLDEQIGIICRFCNYVKMDIRDVMPSFMTTNGQSSSKEHWGKDNFRKLETYILGLSTFDHDISNSNFASFHEKDSIWSLIPAFSLKLYDHQKKAFEFIWRNIAGSLKPKEMEAQSKSTGGCIISHSPGSGKTFLLISFIISYLTLFPKSKPLVLAPKIAISIWKREFEKWGVQFPLHIIQPAESYKKNILNGKRRTYFSDKRRPNMRASHIIDCLMKLQKWHEESSILLMSYTSFSLMEKDSKFEHKQMMAKVLQESTGLLILDEGHNPRSTNSKLRNLLMEVKTKSRVLLSGTLFQNNFEEYFNTLSLARPSFIEDVLSELSGWRKRLDKRSKKKERLARRLFMQRVGEKILSSMEDDRKQGFDVLNKITNGFIDTYEEDTTNSLPGLQIYTLVLLPTDIQHELLVKLQSRLKQPGKYMMALEVLISVGSVHPWLINTMAHANEIFTDIERENIEKQKENYMSGSKMKFIFDLVHKSNIRGEKVLIFSHNLSPINFIVKLFENIMGWSKGDEVLVLQGEQELSVREKIMEKFNGDATNRCKLLIASTSACAEGISLTAASRVVLLDSEWNHSKTRQAIARAFRPGQERKVYVYKLLASETWEEDKYRRNECKAWLSKMVYIGEYIKHNSRQEVNFVEDELLRELVEEDQVNMFKTITKQD